jgi:Tol biopolymer transport system component
MKRTIIALVFVAACGGVTKSNDTIDGGSGQPPPDMGSDAPKRCNPNAPFQTPVPLATLNTASSDEGGWLSPDELTIYFDSTRSGSLGLYDVFMATRDTRDAAFSNVMPVTGVNDPGHQRGPIVTADGLTMYALIGTAPDYNIGRATRASTAEAFSALAAIAALDTTSNDEPTSMVPDGSVLYFDSNRSGTYKMYRVTRKDGKFGVPLPVSGVDINDTHNDSAPIISADELTLFFSSDRPGGVGSNDVWMATRSTTADGFGAPVNLQVVNTPGLDGATWISPDGCVLYLSGGPCCTYDMFVSKRGM